MFKKLFTFRNLRLYALIGGVGMYFNRDRILLKISDKYLKNHKPQLRSVDHKTIGEVLSDYFSSITLIPLQNENKYSNEVQHEDIPEVKEYQKDSILKVQSYYDKAYSYDKKLQELNKTKEEISESLKKNQLNEEKTIKEILKIREETFARAQDLNNKSLKLNTERLDMVNLILKKQNDYMHTYDKISNQLHTCFEKGLKSLSNITVEPLKKDEEENRDLLIRKIEEITQAQRHNWNNQFNYIVNEIKDNSSLLNQYSDSINKFIEQNKKTAKAYLDYKHDEYDLLNKAFSLDLVLENNERNKAEMYSSRLVDYKKDNKKNVLSNIYPNLISSFNNETDHLLKIVSNGTKDEILKIQHNFDFLINSFKATNLDILVALKYLLNNPNYSHLYLQNISKLQKIAKLHGDDFVNELLSNVNSSKNKFCTQKDIQEEYQRVRNDLVVNFLLERKYNILTVMMSPLIGLFSRGILRVYNPLFNPINKDDKEIVKKYKALSFIGYYIRRGNYEKAFENMKYLNQAYQSNINGLALLLEGRIKNSNALDLLERHII